MSHHPLRNIAASLFACALALGLAGCGDNVCDQARARATTCLETACDGEGAQPYLCDHRDRLEFDGCPGACESSFQRVLDEEDCGRALNHFSNAVSICVDREQGN